MNKIKCLDCKIEYSKLGLDLVLPDQQWKFLCPTGGILCANCICKRVSKLKGSSAILAWIDNFSYDSERPKEWLPKDCEKCHIKRCKHKEEGDGYRVCTAKIKKYCNKLVH